MEETAEAHTCIVEEEFLHLDSHDTFLSSGNEFSNSITEDEELGKEDGAQDGTKDATGEVVGGMTVKGGKVLAPPPISIAPEP
jgi:hypothetical protein